MVPFRDKEIEAGSKYTVFESLIPPLGSMLVCILPLIHFGLRIVVPSEVTLCNFLLNKCWLLWGIACYIVSIPSCLVLSLNLETYLRIPKQCSQCWAMCWVSPLKLHPAVDTSILRLYKRMKTKKPIRNNA